MILQPLHISHQAAAGGLQRNEAHDCIADRLALERLLIQILVGVLIHPYFVTIVAATERIVFRWGKSTFGLDGGKYFGSDFDVRHGSLLIDDGSVIPSPSPTQAPYRVAIEARATGIPRLETGLSSADIPVSASKRLLLSATEGDST